MPEPRRILFITRSLSSARGGMQLYTSTLVSELSARSDVRLSVVSFTAPVLFLPLFAFYAALRGIFFRGDTVHIGDAALSPVGACIRLFRPSRRITLTTYGLDVTYRSLVYQAMLRLTLPRFSKIVAISHATAAVLAARGVPTGRIAVIPCGIRLPPASSDLDRRTAHPVLLLLGRQIKRKGTMWFLRNVFPDVLKMHPAATCIIAGGGSELPRIRSLVAESFLQHSVTVLGEIDEPTKDRLLREATLFLMPNVLVPGDMEGFGLVCIEAAARGLPVVAAGMEGIRDAVIEGVTGLFFFSEDAADACRVIDAALTLTWDRSAMVAACAERFSSSVLASRYVSDVF